MRVGLNTNEAGELISKLIEWYLVSLYTFEDRQLIIDYFNNRAFEDEDVGLELFNIFCKGDENLSPKDHFDKLIEKLKEPNEEVKNPDCEDNSLKSNPKEYWDGGVFIC